MTDRSEDAAPRAVADGRRSAPQADAFGSPPPLLSLPPPPPTPPPPSPPLSSPPGRGGAAPAARRGAAVADDRCEALLLGPLPTARAIDVGRNGAASPCLSGCSSSHRCGADGSGSPLSHRVALTFNELKARAHQQAVLVDAMRRERQVARSQLAILERERDYYKSALRSSLAWAKGMQRQADQRADERRRPRPRITLDAPPGVARGLGERRRDGAARGGDAEKRAPRAAAITPGGRTWTPLVTIARDSSPPRPVAAAPPAAAPPDVAARAARKIHRSAMLAQLRRAARLDAAAEHDAEAADPLRREAAYHGPGRPGSKARLITVASRMWWPSSMGGVQIQADHLGGGLVRRDTNEERARFFTDAASRGVRRALLEDRRAPFEHFFPRNLFLSAVHAVAFTAAPALAAATPGPDAPDDEELLDWEKLAEELKDFKQRAAAMLVRVLGCTSLKRALEAALGMALGTVVKPGWGTVIGGAFGDLLGILLL
ncbi:hypothetical protein JL721_4619 [Aureococcus anophagefferens]|nr:hypothetical protein JL721_4619 [Aureococcus anophagefferens]